ncbi:MAG: SDR family oxidoreductase [Deltaproteobacteria bacterium]|nr:SDR family oxidoreductase [Deltaproteobacteria bacterium]MBN2671914.1 SDR family oxidoreductase [Deltaproteobacteria bacterium]
MAIAIVTGASRGIGLAIVKRLTAVGITTYGFARQFDTCDLESDLFHKVICDVTDIGELCVAANQIIRKEKRIDLLVNNAGIGVFGPHDTLEVSQIDKMVRTNVTAPFILSSQLLFWLRKSSGTIVNIASTSGFKVQPQGAAYSATKAALLHFGECLFEEARKQGVRVTTICPDITADTGFYEQASFEPTENEDTYILPGCVADAVMNVLHQRPGTVISQIVVQPQRFQITKRQPSS